MTKRKRLSFANAVILLCVAMSGTITAAVVYEYHRLDTVLPAGVVTALLGLWGGELLIVAHTSARRLISIFMLPLGSIATAYSTFVGQNWGAGRRDRVRQSLMSVMAMEVGWGVFSCAFIYLFGSAAVRLLTNTSDPVVLKNAVLSLRIHLVCYPALGILLALRTALQAMGHRIAPVLSSMFELGIKLVSGIWLIPAFGYLAACLTEPVIWTVCMVFLLLIFWIRKPLDQA